MKPFITLFTLLVSYATMAQRPELILTNGRIFTSDTAQLYVEALAINGGRITAVGTTAKIEQLATPQTKRLNLGGMLVVPGFNDAHNHLPDGFRATYVTLPGQNPPWPVVLDSLRQVVKRVPEGQWIRGLVGPSVVNSPEATRFVLDSIAPKHPVLLLSFWYHVGVYNSLGMQRVGIAFHQPDPKGGFYERLPDGKTLTGKAYEKNAYWPNTSYAKLITQRDNQALINQFKALTQSLLKAGVTSYQVLCNSATVEDYIALWQQAGLPFRLRLIRWGDINPDGSLSIPSKKLPRTTPKLPLLTISGTKWLLDGTTLEAGAAQVDAYPNRPNWHGRMNYTAAEIDAMCREAIARQDQLHFHVIGSETTRQLLAVMSRIPVDWKALRPRFEHGDEVDYQPQYLEQARGLGVVIVQNPTHFAPVNGVPVETPLKHGLAFKSVLTEHIPLAIGSDGPFNPYLNIMFASTHPLRPSEAISREQAVIAYTRGAAYAEFAERDKGTLGVGKVADLVVLSQNIFTIPPARLLQTESVLTLINGRVVYNSGLLKIAK